MRKLILIKHALPEIEAGRAAQLWRLSEEGQLRCKWLAGKLVDYHFDVICASSEPKAVETANIVAAHLGKSSEVIEGLHEHDRSNLSFLPAEEFRKRVATFLAQPNTLVLGRETATQAQRRFTGAVQKLLAKHLYSDIAIVAHGTVITLFVDSHVDIEPFLFWQKLELPSFVVMSLPDLKLKMVVALCCRVQPRFDVVTLYISTFI